MNNYNNYPTALNGAAGSIYTNNFATLNEHTCSAGRLFDYAAQKNADMEMESSFIQNLKQSSSRFSNGYYKNERMNDVQNALILERKINKYGNIYEELQSKLQTLRGQFEGAKKSVSSSFYQGNKVQAMANTVNNMLRITFPDAQNIAYNMPQSQKKDNDLKMILPDAQSPLSRMQIQKDEISYIAKIGENILNHLQSKVLFCENMLYKIKTDKSKIEGKYSRELNNPRGANRYGMQGYAGGR